MEHKWKTYEGTEEVDIFAAEDMPSENHNGPKCIKCGFQFCHHCNPEGYKTECGEESIKPDEKNIMFRI